MQRQKSIHCELLKEVSSDVSVEPVQNSSSLRTYTKWRTTDSMRWLTKIRGFVSSVESLVYILRKDSCLRHLVGLFRASVVLACLCPV